MGEHNRKRKSSERKREKEGSFRETASRKERRNEREKEREGDRRRANTAETTTNN